MEKSPPSGTPLLAWSATEHTLYERSKIWYTVAAILIAGCVIFSVVTGAWSFTAITALTAAFYFYTHRLKHTEHEIKIWDMGFSYGETFSDWNECAGFWILRGNNFAELHIQFKDSIKGEVKIQTGNTDPYQIHQVLSEYLTEYPDKNENVLDTISRICKL
jgi:hypothetical protein